MILQAKNISKRYGNHLAVNNIHLQFEKGTFNAILGPNGAGKSTCLLYTSLDNLWISS